MKKLLDLRILINGVLLAFAIDVTAQAGTIIDPATVSSPQGDFGGNYALVNLINQSGLSAAYVSGVTDFTSYTASTTHSENRANVPSGFTNQYGNFPQSITFTLPGSETIDAISLWATNNPGSITQFALYDAANNQLLGPTNAAAGNGGANPAQDFYFTADTTTSLTLIVLNTAFGTSADPGLGQVAFEAVDAPEPASLALLGAGLASLGFARRCKS